MEDGRFFIGYLIQMNMIVSRFLTKTNQDKCINIVNHTFEYFNENRKKQSLDVVYQAVELLIHHYGEFQSKIPLNTDFGKLITKYLIYYIEERKKL
jgi:hypothetical protein